MIPLVVIGVVFLFSRKDKTLLTMFFLLNEVSIKSRRYL